MAIIITGNPGVGKHTITKEASKHLKIPVIDINDVAKQEGLLEKNGDSNDVDVTVLEKIIKEKISEPILIVGHLAPYVVSPDQAEKVIVLRKNPYDLIPIYKERRYTWEKARDNAGSEILGITTHDAIDLFGVKVFQIDVTGKSISEITRKVLSIIAGNKINEVVDWLGLVTRNNDLQKFFAY
jgi:adenylate kinase